MDLAGLHPWPVESQVEVPENFKIKTRMRGKGGGDDFLKTYFLNFRLLRKKNLDLEGVGRPKF